MALCVHFKRTDGTKEAETENLNCKTSPMHARVVGVGSVVKILSPEVKAYGMDARRREPSTVTLLWPRARRLDNKPTSKQARKHDRSSE